MPTPRFMARSDHDTYAAAGWLFRRLLGLVYLAAFWSLGVQILGLVGRRGILPAAVSLERAGEVLRGAARFRLLPTLFWVNASDTALEGACLAGGIVSALATAGIAPAAAFFLAWLLYLSLTIVTSLFLSYQWDALLLETGLLAIFVAPWSLRDRRRDAADPPRLGRWLMLWLLFRLMVGSGAVKLTSGDPTWRRLTALSYHFWTQPIPTPAAWIASRLPSWALAAATAATLAIELGAPFFILARRRARTIACALLLGLQALIAITGNYAFFNLLTAALCLFMLDDAVLAAVGAGSIRRASGASVPDRLRSWGLAGVAIATMPISAVVFARTIGIEIPDVPPVGALANLVEPFRSVNAYGLFAVMTTSRPAIVIEGSVDGEHWIEYPLKYQPVAITDRPRWVAPHQPRLDWQLWFAALSRYEDEPWFQRLLVRLLEGSPEVLGLFARDPFGGRPPRYVRAVLYEFRFAAPAERRNGAWWERRRVGLYAPELTLERR